MYDCVFLKDTSGCKAVFKLCNVDQDASKDSFFISESLIVIGWIEEYRLDYYRRSRLCSRWHGIVFFWFYLNLKLAAYFL